MEKYKIIYRQYGTRQGAHTFYLKCYPKDIIKSISSKLSTLTSISQNYFNIYVKCYQYNGWIRLKSPLQIPLHQRLIEVMLRIIEPYHLYPLQLKELEEESQASIIYDMQFFFSSPLYNPKNPASSLAKLDYESELKSIIHKLESLNIKINFGINNATSDNLFNPNSIKSKILHISCHGAYDEKKKDYYLCFEDSDKIATRMNLYSKVLQYKLTEETDKSIQLVFISACHSEYIGEVFIKCGIPSAIAVNSATQISDHSAQIFAVSFYSNIFSGKTVREAFDEAIKCNQNNVHKYRLCCCSHSHKPTCKLSKYSGDKMHELHCLACNCNLRNDIRYHNIGCKAAQEFCTNFKIETIMENGALVVCCCHPELPHNEYYKFKLLGNGDQVLYRQSIPGAVSVFNGKNINMFKAGTQIDSIVGRNDVLYEAIKQITSKVRIINIVGTVGTGKKTIAISVTKYLEERWMLPMGALYINVSPSQLLNLQLINVIDDPEKNSIEKVYSFLKNEKLIIILDNCQEINPSDELLKFTHQLFGSTQHVKIICVSTIRLPFVPVENVIKVDPLRPRHLATIIRNECASELQSMDNIDSILQQFTVELSKSKSVDQLFSEIIPSIKLTKQLSNPAAINMLKRSQSQTTDNIFQNTDIALFAPFMYGIEEKDFKSYLNFLNESSIKNNKIEDILEFTTCHPKMSQPFNYYKLKNKFSLPKGLSANQTKQMVVQNEKMLEVSFQFCSLLANHLCEELRDIGYYETIFDFNLALRTDIWNVKLKSKVVFDSYAAIPSRLDLYLKSFAQLFSISYIIEYFHEKLKAANDLTNIAIAYLTIMDLYETDYSISPKHLETVKPLLECLLRLNYNLLSGKLMVCVSSYLLKIYKKMPSYNKARFSILEEAREQSKRCLRAIKQCIVHNEEIVDSRVCESDANLLIDQIEQECHSDSEALFQTYNKMSTKYSRLRALLSLVYLKKESTNKSVMYMELNESHNFFNSTSGKYGIYLIWLASLAGLYTESTIDEKDIGRAKQLIAQVHSIKVKIKRKALIEILDPLILYAENRIYKSEVMFFHHLVCQPLINERGFPIEHTNQFKYRRHLYDDLKSKNKLISYQFELLTMNSLQAIDYETNKILHISSNYYNSEGIPLCNSNLEYAHTTLALKSNIKLYLVFLEFPTSELCAPHFTSISDCIISFSSIPFYQIKELPKFSREFYASVLDGNGIHASIAIAADKVPSLRPFFHVSGEEQASLPVINGYLRASSDPLSQFYHQLNTLKTNNLLTSTAMGKISSPVKKKVETSNISDIGYAAFNKLNIKQNVIISSSINRVDYELITAIAEYCFAIGLVNKIICTDMQLVQHEKNMEIGKINALFILINAKIDWKDIIIPGSICLFINPTINILDDLPPDTLEIQIDTQ